MCSSFLACASLVYYGIVLYRVRVTSARFPTARDGLALPEPEGGWPRVTVVVPAHNEADVIAYSARSLRDQDYPHLRVVYSLDRCTDGTESVLRDALTDQSGERSTNGSRSWRSVACPNDWAGKTNAIWRAVRDSEATRDADCLLFTDADTEFDPSLVRSTVALLRDRGVGMISLLSTLTFDAPFEKRYQPSAGFELVRQFPIDQINNPGDRTRNFANGQFMLFTREAYEAVGGHEAVKDHLLEDLAFARLLSPRHTGERVNTLLAEGMLICRMYRSIEAYRKGWKRIFTEAARRRPARLRASANRLILTGVIFPFCAVLALIFGAAVVANDTPLGVALLLSGGGSLLVTVATLADVYRSQGAPARLVVWYPFGAVHTSRLLREAARDLEAGVATEWGGKSYTREVKA